LLAGVMVKAGAAMISIEDQPVVVKQNQYAGNEQTKPSSVLSREYFVRGSNWYELCELHCPEPILGWFSRIKLSRIAMHRNAKVFSREVYPLYVIFLFLLFIKFLSHRQATRAVLLQQGSKEVPNLLNHAFLNFQFENFSLI